MRCIVSRPAEIIPSLEKWAYLMRKVLARKVKAKWSLEKKGFTYAQGFIKTNVVYRLCKGAYSEEKNYNFYPTTLDLE